MPRKKESVADEVHDTDFTPQESPIPGSPDFSGQELIDELKAQGITTPEDLRALFKNIAEMSITIQQLQERVQELQQRQNNAQEIKAELEDLKTLTAKGREIQELRKVFGSQTSPLELALASKLLMEKDDSEDLRREIEELKNAIIETKYASRINELEQQIITLSNQPPKDPISEIKNTIQAYQSLRSELQSLGLLQDNQPQKPIDRLIDSLGNKLFTFIEKYAPELLSSLTSTKSSIQPPPPPSQTSQYTQEEFNQASQEWINRVKGQIKTGHIIQDDQGFIIGRGDYAKRYIISKKPIGIQPFISGEYYVIPNTLRDDFIAYIQETGKNAGKPKTGF